MGFQGTFKGTLKENFDRMMNPRKFLNEMDQFGNTQLSNMGIEKFEENGLYGLKDSNGEIIIEPIYSSIDTEAYVNGLVTCYLPNGEKRRVDISTESDEMEESTINEDGFDKDGDAYGFGRPEVDVTKFEVGDLVFDKSVGQSGLVALVTSVEGGNTELYYRGYNGDRETLSSDELDDIVDAYPKFIDILVNKGDISAYESIAKKLGITLNPKYARAEERYRNDDGEFEEDPYMEEVAMPNLVENYNRIQILNKKLPKKNLNEVGFDQNGNPMGFDNSEEGYGDAPIDSRPKKGDAVYLQTGYQDVASRIMYIDATHIYWKTDSVNTIETGSKGGVYHIGQLRNKQLYNDLLTWMNTGDKTALETTKYKDI